MKLVTGKLSNEKFVSKAPEALVNAEREKLADYESKHAVVLKRLDELKICKDKAMDGEKVIHCFLYLKICIVLGKIYSII